MPGRMDSDFGPGNMGMGRGPDNLPREFMELPYKVPEGGMQRPPRLGGMPGNMGAPGPYNPPADREPEWGPRRRPMPPGGGSTSHTQGIPPGRGEGIFNPGGAGGGGGSTSHTQGTPPGRLPPMQMPPERAGGGVEPPNGMYRRPPMTRTPGAPGEAIGGISTMPNPGGMPPMQRARPPRPRGLPPTGRIRRPTPTPQRYGR